MSKPPNAPPPRRLYKHVSWSPDMLREEAWHRKKHNHLSHSRSKSLSEDDLQELKACFELGFGFDSGQFDTKLSDTIPALELYHAVNKQYNKHSLSRSSSSSSIVSDNDDANPTSIFNPVDDLAAKKTRLKQWAKMVACVAQQSSQTSASGHSNQAD
ncbi:hypothetical protein TSUD_95400 [Trifolium subterraneum]|uniref:Uncharacterized protein n=1 Tax=Trifolium subterraneum TaxID=3900 RepID=A0A2Z6MUU3_TRISU|nr:hypothetical protein TSUD_95400 [Trifolium subterraneum]